MTQGKGSQLQGVDEDGEWDPWTQPSLDTPKDTWYWKQGWAGSQVTAYGPAPTSPGDGGQEA